MSLQQALNNTLGDVISKTDVAFGQITIDIPAEHWLSAAKTLCQDPALKFQQAVDLCGIDYLEYNQGEWAGEESVSYSGYSRGVEPATSGRLKFGDDAEGANLGHPRFAVITHLLSYEHNWRLRVRVFCPDDQAPELESVVSVWSGLNWFEREAFDLFGIVFTGHPDLRRILTDYGFVGHPFRKDFPLIGHVEVRYDPEQGRVVYEPVSIEPRVLVPKVHREDSRYIDLNES